MKNQTEAHIGKGKKKCHPVHKTIVISPEQRSAFVGIGGSNLKRIYSKAGVTISQSDDNKYSMFAPNQRAMDDAEEMIKSFLESRNEPELAFGTIYKAKVVEVVANGLMVRIFPTMKPVLLPNSQLPKKVMHGSVSGYSEGQEIRVKYFGRDPVNGFMRLSNKAIYEFEKPMQNLF